MGVKEGSVSTINLSGYRSGKNTTIYCGKKSICNIQCMGWGACEDTRVHCLGSAQCPTECTLDTDCPNVITAEPTSIPTIGPSQEPTLFPIELAHISTKNPTEYPTALPSYNPTIEPIGKTN